MPVNRLLCVTATPNDLPTELASALATFTVTGDGQHTLDTQTPHAVPG
jgi:hypothetical protein